MLGGPVQNRDELLAAIAARLDRIEASGDPSSVLDPSALTEAGQLMAAVAGHSDPAAWGLAGWLHWQRYRALPAGQDESDLDAAVDLFTRCFIVGSGRIPAGLLPTIARKAFPAGVAILQQALQAADQDLTSAAVELWQRIVDATPTDSSRSAHSLNNLGGALHYRFEQAGSLDDLDAAIDARRSAAEIIPADDPEWASSMSNLAFSLRVRAARSGSADDLDAAIRAGVEAVRAAGSATRCRGS